MTKGAFAMEKYAIVPIIKWLYKFLWSSLEISSLFIVLFLWEKMHL